MLKHGSVRDFASAFEHERQALVKDLETMRLQLVRKEEQHKKSTAIASTQLIALKKELAELQSHRALTEKESDMYQQKCRDLTTLLETSYDQHEEDQLRIVKLNENLKRLKKKYDDNLELAKREATISVMNTHEERKSLKANTERLRCKLNSERKEWLDAKQTMTEQVEEHRARTDCLERELREAKLSEKNHRLCQEQLYAELRSIKHDLSAAHHDYAVAKASIEKYKSEICRVVEETRIQRDCDQTLLERVHMAQEDAMMSWRSRSALFHENCTLKQNLYAAQQKYEAIVTKRKQEKAASQMLSEELSDVRRNTKRMSIAWEEQSVEQNERTRRANTEAIQLLKERHAAEVLQLQVDHERKGAKNDAANKVLLEELKQQHREEMQKAREVVEKQMQTAVHQVQALCETTQHKLQSVSKEKELLEMQVRELQDDLESWREKERKLIQIMEHSQKMNTTLEERYVLLECKHMDAQKQIDELTTSIKSLHSTIGHQRELIEELERSRHVKSDEHSRELVRYETEKLECLRQIAQLQEQHSQDVLAMEIIKRNQENTVKQITQAQLSANRLIEEQAKTIEDLLETRMAEPATETGACRRAQCAAVADELFELQTNQPQLQDLQSVLKQSTQQVTSLEREKLKLMRVIEDQAVTIHELTIQDETSEKNKWGDETSLSLDMATEMTEELSSAITFVIYGVSSFCIFTAYSTVFRHHHRPGCCHAYPMKKTIEINDVGQDNLSEPQDGDKEEEREPPPLPLYYEYMPKERTLQEHHPAYLPLYTCVCQLPVATPVTDLPPNASIESYPVAVCVSCDVIPFPKASDGIPTTYSSTKAQFQQKCPQSPSSKSPTTDTIFKGPPPQSNYVLVMPTALVDTCARRDMSLYRAKIQVGLPVATAQLKDIYSIRIELNCPDNDSSHLVASIMWCITATASEVKKIRTLMQFEVDDPDAFMALEIESRQDIQNFLDAVTMFPLWADAHSLRKFCQMW